MANIIDSLVISLSLDPKGFVRGQKEATSQFKKTKDSFVKGSAEIEDSSKKAIESIANIGKAVLELYVAFTAGKGMKDFVEHITRADAATGRLSNQLAMSAQELSAWEGAAEQVGGSAEGIAGSMQSLTGQIQKFALTGQSDLAPLLNYLGVSIWNSAHKLKDAGTLFKDISGAIQGRDPRQAKALLDLAGLGDQGTVNLLMAGPAAIERYLAAVRKYAPTKEDIAAAQQRQMMFAQLTLASEKLGRTIVTWLNPALKSAMEYLQQLADWSLTGGKDLFSELGRDVKDWASYVGDELTLLKAVFFGTNDDIRNAWKKLCEDLKKFWTDDFLNSAMNGLLKFGFYLEDRMKAWGMPKWMWEDKYNPSQGGSGVEGWRKDHGMGTGAGGSENQGGVSGAFGRMGGVRGSAGDGAPEGVTAGTATRKGWWTPERQSYAIDYLMRNAGLSRLAAAGLVSRWKNVESPGGPSSLNPNSGAFGIGQWLGARKAGIFPNANFDAQLGYVAQELNSTESRSASILRNARTAYDAARGASAYERAEGYNPRSGTDLFTGRTATGIPSVLGAAPAPASPYGDLSGAIRSMRSGPQSYNNNTTSTETHIGQVNVHTQAKDAEGIAADLKPALQRKFLMTQANYGLA